MHAIWVQVAVVVVVIKTLRQHGRFGFWPSESGGVRRRCSDACREGAQTHRTGKKKEKINEKKKKEKKKKEKRTHCKPIHRLHGTGSSMPAVSLWVEGRGRSRADHRPHAEIMGGRGEGHARVIYAMWVQAVVVKTSRWRGNLIFRPGRGGGVRGWCLGACREVLKRTGPGKKKEK